jgi:hypothetical protein
MKRIALGVSIILLTSLGIAGEPTSPVLLGDWESVSRVFEGAGVLTITREFISWGTCPPVRYIEPVEVPEQDPVDDDSSGFITLEILDEQTLCNGRDRFVQFAIEDSKRSAVISFYESAEAHKKGYMSWGIFAKAASH